MLQHIRTASYFAIAFVTAFAAHGQDAATSGQDKYKFKVLYTGDHLPAEAQDVLVNAHGGFAIDRRDGHGDIYFALPGAGIIRLSADFSKAEMVDTDEAVKSENMHNTTIWYGEGGNTFLVFPGNNAGKVFTTTPDGKLVNILEPPVDHKFDVDAVNKYFAEGGKFVPTDVEYLGGQYYITTGYSPLDYVLTADVSPADAATNWAGLAFGGKGDDPGQFGTGHGITIAPDGETIAVADRPKSEVDMFDAAGAYLNTLNLPAGSFPCDIDFEGDYAVVGCLHGPDREKGAPIYVLKGRDVVSTVMPKEDLGLANFQHIHNAVMTERNGKLYIIAQAWNPGGFAVLEQVTE